MCSGNTYVFCNDTADHDVGNVQRAFSIVIMIIIASLILITNGFITTVLYNAKSIPLATKYLMTSLCLSDFIVSWMLFFPIVAAIYDRWIFGEVICTAVSLVLVVALSTTCQSFLAMSFDKYIAIRFPLRYNSIVTKNRVVFVIGFNWFGSISIIVNTKLFTDFQSEYSPIFYSCSVVYASKDDFHASLASTPVGVLLIVILQIALNIHIYWIAKQHRKRIASTDESENKINLKGLKTILVASGCFVVCWLPSIANLFMILLSTHELPDYLLFISYMFMYSNSFCNWYIYTKTHSVYRKEQQEIWKRVKKAILKEI